MNNLKLEVFEMTPLFIYGRLDQKSTHKIMDEISAATSDIDLIASEIGSEADSAECVDIRRGSQAWVKDTPHTSYILQKIAFDANEALWDIPDIDTTYPSIQYTLYKDPTDHYDWHQDYYDDSKNAHAFHRKVSLSLCLSHDDMYEGAEFFIKDGSASNVRYFKMKYGDFIVFPSDVEHRVNALRSGERLSLVVWYGTPVE